MLEDYPETLINIEWHSPGYTPGNSDFDIPEYSTRGNLYGVNGTPHTQWNGVQETIGGYPNGDWEAWIGTFTSIYNSMVGDNTPYDIQINGAAGNSVTYDVIISMDADMSNSNQKVDIFLVEDNIWSYWSGAGSYHNAHNVARDWLLSENLSISEAGDSEAFYGSFELSDNWNSDSLKIIAIVQNYSTKQIYQVSEVNINEMNPDIDDDGILNNSDNCIELWNPEQEDTDDDLLGDACDPCNNIIYVLGNMNGDVNMDGSPKIDVFDVIKLINFIQTEQFTLCQNEVMNVNNDDIVNIMDVIDLIQLILNGNNE